MRVKKVEYIDGYRLKLLFSDEKTKIVDLSDLVKTGGFYFDPLRDIEFFKKVSLDDEKYPLSIQWPNDADVCPDVLYEIGEDVQELKNQTKPKIRHNRKNASKIICQASAMVKRTKKSKL